MFFVLCTINLTLYLTAAVLFWEKAYLEAGIVLAVSICMSMMGTWYYRRQQQKNNRSDSCCGDIAFSSSGICDCIDCGNIGD
ncbi:hypothetical protein IC620_05470 [Hazenella sp. IB182357]|uniref:Uncharacterized protein n=1 Tax=Polycladospora coralii TaxID=2771432 RepID=A0A926RTV3_9BACL|nr:hypothetical protein [Polycladospora coralii]MBD1371807.1 hypothetical protein [Polycladospora coralii]MBS7529268.1 hypothetical protein [Polycladospora coralii]